MVVNTESKIPKKFSILGSLWTVVLTPYLLSDEGEAQDGYADVFNKIIYIRIFKNANHAYLHDVLWHELLHAYIFESGLANHPKWDREVEEVLVDGFGMFINRTLETIVFKGLKKSDYFSETQIKQVLKKQKALNFPMNGKYKAPEWLTEYL